jgi:hypothetical protein
VEFPSGVLRGGNSVIIWARKSNTYMHPVLYYVQYCHTTVNTYKIRNK